jgi:hypothetical protein
VACGVGYLREKHSGSDGDRSCAEEIRFKKKIGMEREGAKRVVIRYCGAIEVASWYEMCWGCEDEVKTISDWGRKNEEKVKENKAHHTTQKIEALIHNNGYCLFILAHTNTEIHTKDCCVSCVILR